MHGGRGSQAKVVVVFYRPGDLAHIIQTAQLLRESSIHSASLAVMGPQLE
jgi:hypothetical protein